MQLVRPSTTEVHADRHFTFLVFSYLSCVQRTALSFSPTQRLRGSRHFWLGRKHTNLGNVDILAIGVSCTPAPDLVDL